MQVRTAALSMMVVAAALGAGGAWADGYVCTKYRDTTADERQAMTTVLATLKARLPPAPEGWIIGGYEEFSVHTSICQDVETIPWAYSFTRIYNRTDDLEQRAQLEEEARAALRAAAEQRQPRLDALMARNAALGAELAEAAQAGDQARIDSINAQIALQQQEFEHLMNEGVSAEQTTALMGALMQDRSMEINVAVNPASVATEDTEAQTAPAGAQAAFRRESTREGVTTAESLVLLGNWAPRLEGGLVPARRGAASAAAAHGMAVRVRADPARLDSLLEAIDFAALAALLP
jgi:hypothetical protein